MDFGSPKRGFGHPKSDLKMSSQQISWKRWKYYKTSEIMKHTSSKIHCFRSPNLAKICLKLGSETGPSINRVFVVSCLDLGGFGGSILGQKSTSNGSQNKSRNGPPQKPQLTCLQGPRRPPSHTNAARRFHSPDPGCPRDALARASKVKKTNRTNC